MHALDSSGLRITVGVPSGLQSGTWRFWITKSDVYVSMRAVTRLLKVSLHSGGQCNFAFTKELSESLGGDHAFPDESRRVDTWRRTPFVREGLEIPLQLHFPTSELRPSAASPTARAHEWIPPAADGFSRVLLLAYGPDLTHLGHVAPQLQDGRVIAAARLPDGQDVHLLCSEIQTEGTVYRAIVQKRALVQSNHPRLRLGDPVSYTDPASRLLVTGTAPTGQRIFVDAALAS
jgi:hypothetical protein